MNISLREIEYILTIAEEGNITKAANRLFIAQPSLSQAVKKVEADLGMPLFSRVKGGLTLTEAGRYFVDAGQRITGIATEMDAAIADLSTLHTGTLNLGTPYHLGSYVVPDLLAVFKKEHPSVRVNLREGTSDELETMICDGLIEAAIMPLPFKQTCISYLPFFTSRMVLVMSRDDPLNRFAYSGSPTDQFPTFDLRNAASAPFLIGMKGHRIPPRRDRAEYRHALPECRNHPSNGRLGLWTGDHARALPVPSGGQRQHTVLLPAARAGL